MSVQHVRKLELCYQAGLPGKECPFSDRGRLDFSDLLSTASSSLEEVLLQILHCSIEKSSALVVPSFCFSFFLFSFPPSSSRNSMIFQGVVVSMTLVECFDSSPVCERKRKYDVVTSESKLFMNVFFILLLRSEL